MRSVHGKFQDRQAEKQAVRDEDQRMIENGEITQEQLRKRNGFFSALDFREWKIVAIGGKPR